MKNPIIEACKKHEFVGVIAYDGHEHTVKAFGNICGTPFFDYEDELKNQLAYCTKIACGQELEILVADTIDEAINEEIIDEFDGKYYIK